MLLFFVVITTLFEKGFGKGFGIYGCLGGGMGKKGGIRVYLWYRIFFSLAFFVLILRKRERRVRFREKRVNKKFGLCMCMCTPDEPLIFFGFGFFEKGGWVGRSTHFIFIYVFIFPPFPPQNPFFWLFGIPPCGRGWEGGRWGEEGGIGE